MKAKLIIKLIEAHVSKNEKSFEKALMNLANDEERKGNATVALSLKNAYFSRKPLGASFADSPLTGISFSAQSAQILPKDKDSTLDLLDILQPTVSLSDVALTEKANAVLRQIIDEQKEADRLLDKGITPTNRVLFCGPPGCGKTFTANALAYELGLEIAYVKLDGLVSSYLGQTGTNIRKIFEYARNKRIMLFLDEFDAIAKKRDDKQELGELKRVVTTLLQNLDAMPASVFLVAATNHHHLLDPAIWRRFDVSILMEMPNEKQRAKIIIKFIKEYLTEYSIDERKLIVITNGMSGSQICTFMKSLVKQLLINDNEKKIVSIDDIARVWLKHNTLFVSEQSDDFMEALYELSKSGVPFRTLEQITGIPKSTLSYRFNKKEV